MLRSKINWISSIKTTTRNFQGKKPYLSVFQYTNTRYNITQFKLLICGFCHNSFSAILFYFKLVSVPINMWKKQKIYKRYVKIRRYIKAHEYVASNVCLSFLMVNSGVCKLSYRSPSKGFIGNIWSNILIFLFCHWTLYLLSIFINRKQLQRTHDNVFQPLQFCKLTLDLTECILNRMLHTIHFVFKFVRNPVFG